MACRECVDIRCIVFCVFLQAEDGIRVSPVTGVQTCALPLLDEIASRGSKSTSAPEIPVGQNIDALTESALGHLENIIHEHRFELRELNREIQHISRRVDSASPDELVSFTDRMLAIEGHLDKLQELSAGEYAPSVDDFDQIGRAHV